MTYTIGDPEVFQKGGWEGELRSHIVKMHYFFKNLLLYSQTLISQTKYVVMMTGWLGEIEDEKWGGGVNFSNIHFCL